MLVKNWMTKDPITATPKTPVSEAYRIFQEYEIRHLPVLLDDKLAGIVSDHDLGKVLLAMATSGGRGEMGTVGEVMTREVRTVSPEESLATAALIMHNEKFGALPVVDEAGNLVGILTVNDLLEVLIARLADTGTETKS